MALYSKQQLAALWVKNGGPSAAAGIAAEVAYAESHGNASATHVNSDGSIDRGAWQINSVHGAQSTLNPDGNARAAVAISKGGTDWSPWVTYQRATTPAIRAYKAGDRTNAGLLDPLNPLKYSPLNPLGLPSLLGDAAGAANGLLGGLPGDAAGAVGKAAGSILPDSVVNFFKLGILVITNLSSPDFYFRAGKVILGFLLGLFAINTILKKSTGTSPVEAATAATKTVSKAVKLVAA